VVFCWKDGRVLCACNSSFRFLAIFPSSSVKHHCTVTRNLRAISYQSIPCFLFSQSINTFFLNFIFLVRPFPRDRKISQSVFPNKVNNNLCVTRCATRPTLAEPEIFHRYPRGIYGGANTIKNKDKELYIFFSRNKLLLKTFLPYHARLNFNVCPASPFWIGDLAIKLQLSGEQMGSLINKSFLYTCAVCASSSVLINDFRIERLFSASLSHRKKSFSGKSLSR
jgi:hypothetical protein